MLTRTPSQQCLQLAEPQATATFSITGPQTTGLVSGTYIVTVTYGNRCTAVGVVLILNPASNSANSKEGTLCNGDANGLVDVTAMGDTAPNGVMVIG